jgi:hypothetical protein
MLLLLEVLNVVIVGKSLGGDEIQLPFASSEFLDNQMTIVCVFQSKSSVESITDQKRYNEWRPRIIVKHS